MPRWGAGAGRAFDVNMREMFRKLIFKISIFQTMYMIGGFTNVEATAVTDSIEKITRNPPVEDEVCFSFFNLFFHF